jgi:hypothetical protein
MTNPAEDFEARLTRVLKVGTEGLPTGQPVPPFGAPHALSPRSRPMQRTISRKVAILGIALGLGLTGTAAAAAVVHLTSAPVTETDLARCYTVDSLAGGNNFSGRCRPHWLDRAGHERPLNLHASLARRASHPRLRKRGSGPHPQRARAPQP